MTKAKRPRYKPSISTTTIITVEFPKIDYMDIHYFASRQDIPVSQWIREEIHLVLNTYRRSEKDQLSRVYPLKQHKLP